MLPVVIQHGRVKQTLIFCATVASPIGGKYLNLDSLRPSASSARWNPTCPPRKVDMKPGDKIFAVNGIPTASSDRMMEVISNKAGSAV